MSVNLDFSLLFGKREDTPAPEPSPSKPYYADLKAEREAPTIANYNRIKAQEELDRQALEAQRKGVLYAADEKTKIMKGLTNGVNPYQLLLWAVAALDYLTNDRQFHNQIYEDLHQMKCLPERGPSAKADPAALEMERINCTYRLENLKAAKEWPEVPAGQYLHGYKQRHEQAIKAHEKRLAEINAAIARIREQP